jgi:hypothetical protein
MVASAIKPKISQTDDLLIVRISPSGIDPMNQEPTHDLLCSIVKTGDEKETDSRANHLTANSRDGKEVGEQRTAAS